MGLEVIQINQDDRPVLLDEKFLQFNEDDIHQCLKVVELEAKNWRQVHSRNFKFYKNYLKGVLYLADPDMLLEVLKLLKEGHFPMLSTANVKYLGKYCSEDTYLQYLES